MIPHTKKYVVSVDAILEPIFPGFLDIQKRYVNDMQIALNARDNQELFRLAHSVRGSAATYQLPDAAAIAHAIELAARENNFDAAVQSLDGLGRYLDTLEIRFVG